MATLKQDLCRDFELIETHISWVFLAARDVYKVKRPVDFGFLDFSSRDKRRAACLAEVELNRRLAPSVYFGVVAITRSQAGEHEIAGQGEAVDWAVHMRRLPTADRADLRLQEGRLSAQQLDAIVTRLARFHESVGPSSLSGVYGGTKSVHENIEENFAQSAQLLPLYLEADEIAELVSWQRGFVSQHEETLLARSRTGRVREGHGDLRLEHIYLRDDGGIDILDCIEFNERFRIADVCADIVFLAMDLASQGRADLAEAVLASYARESNDYDMYALVDFYQSYRAFVRGKISALVAKSGVLGTTAQEHAEAHARRYFLLALASERLCALPTVVVAVGGIIASGKSSVASHLAMKMSCPVVNADRTRKHLAGVQAQRPVDEASFEGMYSPAFTDKTYRELIRRAAQVVQSGRPVVLDATFRSRWSRELAREMADRHHVPFVFVECTVAQETCLARLKARGLERGVSDGRIEIFHDFVKRWEPVIEFEEAQHLVLDTALSLEDNIERLASVIPTWPAGLTGP